MTRRGVALLLTSLAVAALALVGHVSSWKGHNGDHYYYASTAQQYAGVPYRQSLTQTTAYFRYPFPSARLNLGYQHPDVAPLVYPRVVLPLLAAPWVRWLGVRGAYVPGLVLGAVSCWVMALLAWRRVGAVAALAMPALLLGSVLVTEFVFGIYSEAPIVCATAVLTAQLPLGVRRTRWHAVTAAALVPIMMLARQVPLLPVGMVVGGWLWAVPSTRRLRNAWLPFVVTVVPVTAVSYALLARWAPYSPLPFLRAVTGSSTDGQLVGKIPGLFRHALALDITDALRLDHWGLLLVACGLVGLALAVRSPLAGVFIGSLPSGLSAIALNGQRDDFRYAIPSLPPMVLLGAVGVGWMWSRLRRVPWHLPPIAAPARLAFEAASTHEPSPLTVGGDRWRPAWSAITSCAVLAVLVAATVWIHRPADASHAHTVTVSRATWPGPWPLTVNSGTLSCAGGDYQVWLTTSTGTRYAVSGAAMAHSFLTPRVTSIRAGRVDYAWKALVPLLDTGMRLCPGNFGYNG